MMTESSHPCEHHPSWRIALLATVLALSAVICGSIIQTTVASPWLNVLLIVALLLPILRDELRRPTGWLADYYAVYRRALLVIGLGWAIVTAGCYLANIQRTVGSVDLFYYLCNARDMNTQTLESSNAYSYFPGVYLFWKTVLAVTGENMAGIQRSYLCVIAVNVLLVSLIVWQHGRSLAASLFAGTWFLVVISRFQATAAETELLATIPFLVSIVAWSGRPLQGRRGWIDCAILGTGLGLTLYMKQQAGLLSLGALAMFCSYRFRHQDQRHRWALLMVLPGIALLAFLVAVLMVGEGWDPIRIGLATVGRYGQEQSWLYNLYVQLRRDETLGLAFLFSGLATMVSLRRLATRSPLHMARIEVTLFLLIATLATLWQLRSRSYHHYMLLALPGIVIGTVLLWLEVLPDRSSTRRSHRLIRTGMILIAFAPFLRDAGIPESFKAWRLPSTSHPAPSLLWHEQESIARDLVQLQQHISPGSALYALPPRHNSIYFFLQARSSSPSGYSFQQAFKNRTDWSTHPRVLLLKSPAWDASDQALVSNRELKHIQDTLKTSGFRRQLDLPTMVLYQAAP